VSTVDPISLVMKRISDLPLRKVSSRQLNLSGKLLGAPHGLEKGRDLFYSSGVIHYELKSVRLISEVLKT
jgi:hypothetical protein